MGRGSSAHLTEFCTYLKGGLDCPDNSPVRVIARGGEMSKEKTIGKRWGGLHFVVAAWVLIGLLALPGYASDRVVKSKVPPVYPEIAKRMKITGVVKVEATVDADGKVTDVKTLSGSHTLSPAAEEAVRKWKFAPAAATSTEDVDVNFAMAQ
jgi:TonB family protein